MTSKCSQGSIWQGLWKGKYLLGLIVCASDQDERFRRWSSVVADHRCVRGGGEKGGGAADVRSGNQTESTWLHRLALVLLSAGFSTSLLSLVLFLVSHCVQFEGRVLDWLPFELRRAHAVLWRRVVRGPEGCFRDFAQQPRAEISGLGIAAQKASDRES